MRLKPNLIIIGQFLTQTIKTVDVLKKQKLISKILWVKCMILGPGLIKTLSLGCLFNYFQDNSDHLAMNCMWIIIGLVVLRIVLRSTGVHLVNIIHEKYISIFW